MAEDEKYKRELLADITHAIHNLDDAMYIAMVAFSFPFQVLVGILFHKLARRNYHFSQA